jgi:hypothetical protein
MLIDRLNGVRFRFCGTVADLDQTVAGSAPAALVVVIDCADELTQVLVPSDIEQPPSELLAVDRPVLVTGEIAPGSFPCHIATRLELLSIHH